jgi:nucleotide-binding universal stress UspA family protein
MKLLDNYNYRTAVDDFYSAHQKATLEELLANLQGKSNELLSFDEVAKKLKLHTRIERGIQTIPLDAVAGSVGRYTDFTRTFLPRNSSDEDRWARVKASLAQDGFPPIDVYKVSDVYFVLDGNHRVSVARQEGWKTIQAHVIEVDSEVPLSPNIQPDELIIKSEYAQFLRETGLSQQRPNVDLSVTIPGQYEKLRQQIHIHQYYRGLEWKRDVPFEEAVLDWYDNVYIPLAERIRDRGLLRAFPERTITDFYLWVTEHRDTLQEELGWSIRAEAVADVLAKRSGQEAGRQKTGDWRRAKIMERYTETLFKDILVPLRIGNAGWQAMEQALDVARREGATLQGLHVEDSKQKLDSPETHELQERFSQSCEEAGVKGSLALEVGDPTAKILKRSSLVDLIVLKVSYPPATGIAGLASPLRTLLMRAARPVLALPGDAVPCTDALLAFDGSSRAKEALFLATYLAERWAVNLTVFTALDNAKLSSSTQDEARAYLELHEIQAEYVVEKGTTDSVRQVIQERGINQIIMGGYSGSTLKEFFVGSNVSLVLRESKIPVLICR